MSKVSCSQDRQDKKSREKGDAAIYNINDSNHHHHHLHHQTTRDVFFNATSSDARSTSSTAASRERSGHLIRYRTRDPVPRKIFKASSRQSASTQGFRDPGPRKFQRRIVPEARPVQPSTLDFRPEPSRVRVGKAL